MAHTGFSSDAPSLADRHAHAIPSGERASSPVKHVADEGAVAQHALTASADSTTTKKPWPWAWAVCRGSQENNLADSLRWLSTPPETSVRLAKLHRCPGCRSTATVGQAGESAG
jgi:hypothetical protein